MPIKPIPGRPPSEEVRAQLAREEQPVLLAFSAGKDSIATWLALREAGVREIIPYCMQGIPGLPLIEEALSYAEDFFGTHIMRVTHPSLYRKLNALVFQPPERARIIEAAALPNFEYGDVLKLIREQHSCPTAWVADGVRAADSIIRRLSFQRHGVFRSKDRKVSPIYDWLNAEVYDALNAAGYRLPVDYELFGRSFDGIDLRFLGPIAEHRPEDYRIILEWFPLADLELFRDRMKRERTR